MVCFDYNTSAQLGSLIVHSLVEPHCCWKVVAQLSQHLSRHTTQLPAARKHQAIRRYILDHAIRRLPCVTEKAVAHATTKRMQGAANTKQAHGCCYAHDACTRHRLQNSHQRQGRPDAVSSGPSYRVATLCIWLRVDDLCSEYTCCGPRLQATRRKCISAPLILVPKGGFMMTVSGCRRRCRCRWPTLHITKSICGKKGVKQMQLHQLQLQQSTLPGGKTCCSIQLPAASNIPEVHCCHCTVAAVAMKRTCCQQ